MHQNLEVSRSEFPLQELVAQASQKSKLGKTLPRFGLLVLLSEDEAKTFTLPKNLNAYFTEILVITTDPEQIGAAQKRGFRELEEKNLDYLLVVPSLSQASSAEFLSQMLICVLKNPQCTAVMAATPPSSLSQKIFHQVESLALGFPLRDYHSKARLYSTHFLKSIPFAENDDDGRFDAQTLVQLRALGARVQELSFAPLEKTTLSQAFHNCRSLLRTALEYRLHQLHFIRRSRYFFLRESCYTRKKSPYSSHEIILSLLPSRQRVLDVGCGLGLLAPDLRARHCPSAGIDFLAEEYLRGMYDEYSSQDLEALQVLPFSHEFDVAIMADSLEHLRNAKALLKTVTKSLSPGGCVIISTPNIAHWYCRLSLLLGRFNYGEKGILDETHVHFYTLDSLRSLVRNADLEITTEKFTGLPFEVIFESVGQSKALKMLDRFYYKLVQLWPRLFAYQIVIKARLRGQK